ncbi:MAG: Uma2 family endonuclease [Myxacorys chilensis ATA2-1-KO14]|nr:Uma2 family endonuclease [Myxacorys chilensis ATA2-1-KO14]
MLLELSRIEVPPGQHVLLQDVTWEEFERILDELGEHRASRLAYDNGTLEIMSPLPAHEGDKEIIGDLIKALLEELDIEFLTLGSTTFKDQAMLTGIESDQCFYIQNESQVRGKRRFDLETDPPPDLALEINVTSRTHPRLYQALGVSELWRFEQENLQINILKDDRYQISEHSSIFPNLPLTQVIPQYLVESRTVGRNTTLRAFRQWVRNSMNSKE